ncbi:MAG: DUF4340 domain-containing protein [Oligoflexia bacterium]
MKKALSASSHQQWKTPLVLAALLFVLSSLAFWFEFKHKPRSEQAKENAQKAVDLSSSLIASIRLHQPKLPDVVLQCLDGVRSTDPNLCKPGSLGQWQIIEPSRFKADDSNVQSLLSSLNALMPSASIDLSEEPAEQRPMLLKQYGLEFSQRASAATITITESSGRSRTLWIGEKHPLGESRFLMVTDSSQPESEPNKVLVVSGEVASLAAHSVTHWREKRFVPAVASQIKRVILTQGITRIEASRAAPEAQWTLKSQQGRSVRQAPGDTEAIESWLSGIVFLTAEDFAADLKTLPEAKKLLARSKPVLKIELDSGQNKPFAFELREISGAKHSLLALADSLDPLYWLDPGARNRLSKKFEDLQLSKLLASLDRFNTRSIRLESKAFKKSPILIESDESGSKWKRTDTGKDIRDGWAPELLEKLSGKRINRFLTASAQDLKEASEKGLELTLSGQKDGKPQETLKKIRFWRAGSRLLAQDLTAPGDRVLELDATLSTSLPWDAKILE